jgi:hypothetical protein
MDEALQPCSRPSSWCRGRSRKRSRPKSTWRSSSTICGWSIPKRRCSRLSRAAASGWRSPYRLIALPAPPVHRREKVLALCGERRAPTPVRRRAATTGHCGGADRRHERVERLGRIRCRVPVDAEGFVEHEKAKSELKGLMPEDARRISTPAASPIARSSNRGPPEKKGG